MLLFGKATQLVLRLNPLTSMLMNSILFYCRILKLYHFGQSFFLRMIEINEFYHLTKWWNHVCLGSVINFAFISVKLMESLGLIISRYCRTQDIMPGIAVLYTLSSDSISKKNASLPYRKSFRYLCNYLTIVFSTIIFAIVSIKFNHSVYGIT